MQEITFIWQPLMLTALRFEKAFRSYEENVRMEAADPTHVTVPAGFSASSRDLSYMTTIVAGTHTSFLCRRRTCLYYGANHHWIKAKDHDWYRCPACFERYRPWISGPSLVNAQFCVSTPGENGNVPFHPVESLGNAIFPAVLCQSVKRVSHLLPISM